MVARAMPAAKARAVLLPMFARRAASRVARARRSATSQATSEMEPRAPVAPATAVRACCVPQEPAAAETRAPARSASCLARRAARSVSMAPISPQARSALAAPAPPEPAAPAAYTSGPVMPGRAEADAVLAATRARSALRGSASAVCATGAVTPCASDSFSQPTAARHRLRATRAADSAHDQRPARADATASARWPCARPAASSPGSRTPA